MKNNKCSAPRNTRQIGVMVINVLLLFLCLVGVWATIKSASPETINAYADSRSSGEIYQDMVFLDALLNGTIFEDAVQTRADILAKNLQKEMILKAAFTEYAAESNSSIGSSDEMEDPNTEKAESNSASNAESDSMEEAKSNSADQVESAASGEAESNSADDSEAAAASEESDELTEAEIVSESEEVEKTVSESDTASTFDIPFSADLQGYIVSLAEEYEIPAALIIAVIDQESQFDSSSISATNDYGLMQINEINFEWLNDYFGRKIDFLDPYENVEAGIYMLSELYHKYPDSIHLPLMAYNMGEGGARRQWESGVYSSDYSRAVVELYEFYRA